MRKVLTIVGIAAASLAAAGCLQRDVSHTIYVGPAGEAAWVAIEKDVCSDAATPAERRAEEEAYLAAARRGDHPVARGLASLDPPRVRTRILRAEPPYVVATDAAFGDVGALFDRLLREARIPGFATLTRDGTRMTLTLQIAPGDDSDDEPTAAAELLHDFAAFRIVLTEGRFVSASGFAIGAGGRTATAVEPADADVLAPLWLSLTWDTARQ